MKFKLEHEILKNEDVEITCPLWFGKVLVTQKGELVERLPEAHFPFKVQGDDGAPHKLLVRAHFLDPIPKVQLDGKEILLARRLHRVETIFAVLPAGMFLGHGLFAVLLGYFVISTNFKILRSNWHGTLKWTSMYALSLGAFTLLILLEKFAWSQK